jgi:hypothetical protein
MFQAHWQKIAIGAAALILILAAARCEGPAGLADPLSPLTFFSSSPLARVYLPIVGRELNTTAQFSHQTHLPLAVCGYPPATPTPAPAPLPTPEWPPALSQPGRSKLGLHAIQNNSPNIVEFIRRTKPAVVKAVGGFGWLEEVKKVSPRTVTVGRLLESGNEGSITGDPEKTARDFVARHLEEYRLNPAVDYWEGWNEPLPTSNMAWYARFEAERTRQMAAHGFRVAVGGFATGTPEWDEFAAFLPAIEVALAHGGILTLHEYAAPTMDYGMGQALPGRPAYPDRGVLTLRYRWWYEDFLKPRGLLIPLVISEGGIDGQVKQDLAPPGLGWRDFTAYWSRQKLGEGGVQTYIQQLAWYDRQLQQDDYVIGVAVFTVGSPAGQWPSFDITDILPILAQYVVGQQ